MRRNLVMDLIQSLLAGRFSYSDVEVSEAISCGKAIKFGGKIAINPKNMGLLEIEVGVSVAGDFLIRHHDILDVLVDEVVETDQMLLHEAADLEEGRDELPFVLEGETIVSLAGRATAFWWHSC